MQLLQQITAINIFSLSTNIYIYIYIKLTSIIMNPAKRFSQDSKAVDNERAALIEEIERAKEGMARMSKKIVDQKGKNQKIMQSNMRNQKRLLKYKARIQEMSRYKDSPQHFLSISGYMNQCIQEYIFSHNYQLTISPTHINDPDHMTYEQLLDLGEQIGRVSKGLNKEEIEKLKHRKQSQGGESCPICQSEMEAKEIVLQLRCGHAYHEEYENTCPICKECLTEREIETSRIQSLQ